MSSSTAPAALVSEMSIDLSMPVPSTAHSSENYQPQVARPSKGPHKTQAVPLKHMAGHSSNTLPPTNGTPGLQSQTQKALSGLQRQGFPRGLAFEMITAKIAHPIRFWVVDNSGSMLTPDGNELRSIGGSTSMDSASSEQVMTSVSCTRWTELKGAVTYHAELASVLEATTVFRFLNNPGGRVGPQEFTIAGSTEQTVQQELEKAKAVLKSAQPKGATPLTSHLKDIRTQVEAMQELLIRSGQTVVIVLATDGVCVLCFLLFTAVCL